MMAIFLLAGAPAVGKSTTGRALAASFSKSIHIPVDDVRNMVVSGIVQPGGDWGPELIEQLRVARESVVDMANRYNKAGFVVVIDDFYDPGSGLSEYAELIGRSHKHIVCCFIPLEDAALARNLSDWLVRSAKDIARGGIRAVYGFLRAAVDEMVKQGWTVVDTTNLSVDETVTEILVANRSSINDG